VQPFQSQNFPDPIPRPLEQELLQKNLNPKPDRKRDCSIITEDMLPGERGATQPGRGN